jgi:hypothetical protein
MSHAPAQRSTKVRQAQRRKEEERSFCEVGIAHPTGYSGLAMRVTRPCEL